MRMSNSSNRKKKWNRKWLICTQFLLAGIKPLKCDDPRVNLMHEMPSVITCTVSNATNRIMLFDIVLLFTHTHTRTLVHIKYGNFDEQKRNEERKYNLSNKQDLCRSFYCWHLTLNCSLHQRYISLAVSFNWWTLFTLTHSSKWLVIRAKSMTKKSRERSRAKKKRVFFNDF